MVRNQVMENHDDSAANGVAEESHDHGSSHSESSSVAEHHGEHESGEAHSDHHTGSTPKTHVHKDGKEHTHDK